MSLVESMALTGKGLKSAATEGGFFYFIGDPQGENAALMVFSKKKDEDGAKTSRTGRGMLKEFKKEFGKAVFSEGEILAGSTPVFSIHSGNAKPAIIKRAFKSSELLHDGVGKALIGMLKGAKIVMARGEDEPSNTDEIPSTPNSAAPDTASSDLAAWTALPETQKLIEELGLSAEEIEELFQAEQAFSKYADTMPREEDEETELQLRQAETEAILDELSRGEERLRKLRASDPSAATVLETQLNEKRIELAQKNAIGPDPFDTGKLSTSDQAALSAALHTGLKLLLERITTAQQEIEKERVRLETTSEDQKEASLSALALKRSELTSELNAIEVQLQASRPPV